MRVKKGHTYAGDTHVIRLLQGILYCSQKNDNASHESSQLRVKLHAVVGAVTSAVAGTVTDAVACTVAVTLTEPRLRRLLLTD